jgi:hypothetical protein
LQWAVAANTLCFASPAQAIFHFMRKSAQRVVAADLSRHQELLTVDRAQLVSTTYLVHFLLLLTEGNWVAAHGLK